MALVHPARSAGLTTSWDKLRDDADVTGRGCGSYSGRMLRSDGLAIARRYLRAVEHGAVEELRDHVTSDFEQREWPNPMSPQGAFRNLPEVLQAAERGREVVAEQTFQIATEAVDGDRVILEVNWSAVLAVDFPGAPAGSRIRARIAIFLLIRDGRVAAQQNYDAYLPD